MKIIIDKLMISRMSIPKYINSKRFSEFLKRRKNILDHPEKFIRDIEMIYSFLEIEKRMKILEIGAGEGLELYEIANLGAACYGIEICLECAELVDKLADHNNLNIAVIKGDACEMPFLNNFFDGIYAKNTFEHIWDKNKAIKECIRVLKPGALILILDGNPFDPRVLYEQLVKKFIKTKGKYGGYKWILNRDKFMEDYGIGWKGKDEDVRSIFWWKKFLHQFPDLKPKLITTKFYYMYKNDAYFTNKFLKFLYPFYPFIGNVIILAEKIK